MSEGGQKEKRDRPWDGAADRETIGFGTWLRREREAREVTLSEIADVTKISRAYLEALEEERFDVLPAPVFAKGFLKEYASYVGLDPDEVVNSYLTVRQEEEPDPILDGSSSSRGASFEWTSSLLLVLGLLLLLGAVGFVGWWVQRSRTLEPIEVQAQPSTSSALAPALAEPAGNPESELSQTPLGETSEGGGETTPTDGARGVSSDPASVAETVAEVASGPLVVTIDFTEDCWVEASVDGRRRLSELHVQGESLTLDAQRRVALTLGNPDGVRVEVNGAAYDIGEFRPGRVARFDINLDELNAQAADE